MAAVGLAAEPSCPAVHYPRSLRNVLDAHERNHLARIYFEHFHGSGSQRRYYNLLHHLAASKRDETATAVVDKVKARIAREFGDDFLLANDFYSYRSPSSRMFPTWHQDGEFWLTADGDNDASCRGFNLWILLAHREMNYSFDLIEVSSHRWLYEGLYRQVFGPGHANLTSHRPLFSPTEQMRRSQQRGLRGFTPSGRQYADYPQPRATNVPLAAGDALIVRQIELHRTDHHALRPSQWRLALGFKVLTKRRVTRESEPTSPFGHDAAQVRSEWPGLLPEFAIGAPFPTDVYDARRLAALDVAAQHSPLVAWVLGPDGGRLGLVAPLLLLAAVAWGARAGCFGGGRGGGGGMGGGGGGGFGRERDGEGGETEGLLMHELSGGGGGGGSGGGGSGTGGGAGGGGGVASGPLKRTLSAGRRRGEPGGA